MDGYDWKERGGDQAARRHQMKDQSTQCAG